MILVRRDSITTPQALMGKTVGAIDPQAFGGYLTGYKALGDAGIRRRRDFHLRFTGSLPTPCSICCASAPFRPPSSRSACWRKWAGRH
ncbi:phosphate/phosphite/phosphonate ABC transporter substrate-binding protein [Serratia ureilytica]